MPRPLRSFEPGGWYHLTARGNNGRTIVVDEEDRNTFALLLERTAERYGLDVRAVALLPNHYHLVVTTPDGRVSPAMQYFNGSYAAEFNRRHDRTGHLFRERFRATTILTDRHLEHALAYVRDNRAKAGLDPVRWTWLAAAGAVGTAA